MNKKFNTINNIFSECSSLISLPDISNWDTRNFTNIIYMFSLCYKLEYFPDISKWKLPKLKKYMINHKYLLFLTFIYFIIK